jgi:hypothetical protein
VPHGETQLAVDGSPVLVALPQGEVAGVPLAARVGVRGALHVVNILPRQGAVLVPGAHVEVDIPGAVEGGVRVPAVDQLLDERMHLRDVAGCPRLVGGPGHAEGLVGVLELLLIAVGQRPPFLLRHGA